MVQDGFVRYLIDQKKITSYPSRLPYPSWSQKELKRLKNNGAVFVYLKKSETWKWGKINESEIELSGPGIFIPGLGHIETLNFLSQNWLRI
jgi:hypothetical protein